MQKALLLLFFLVFSTFGFALKGIIIQSTDQALLDKWYKTVGNSAPKIQTAQTVYKDQQVFFGIALQDYKTRKNGRSDVRYAIIIKDPAGNIFFEKENIIALQSIIKNKDYVQISEENTFLSFTSPDAFGTYTLSVQAEDRLTGEKTELNSTIRVLPLPAFDNFKLSDQYTFAEWMDNYKNFPEPQKALYYFLLFTKSELSASDDQLQPVLAFFKTILAQNPYLFSEYPEAYIKATEKGKALLALLAYQALGEKTFKKFANNEALLKVVKTFKNEDLYEPVSSVNQINALWAEYEASAQQKPILHLVSALEMKSNPDPSLPENKKNLIFEKLVQSLHLHFKNDALALKYANYILGFENITVNQRGELGNILKQYND